MLFRSFNVINGGSHAGNKLAFQEFMLLPTGASSFTEAMKIGTETYHTLKKVINAKYGIDGMFILCLIHNSKSLHGKYNQRQTLVTRVVSHPTFLVPKKPLSSSLRLSRRLAMRERSRSHSMLLLLSSTRRASTTLTSRTRTPTPPNGSLARNSPISTWASSRNTRLFPLKIRSTRTTGRRGLTSRRRAVSRLSVMT